MSFSIDDLPTEIGVKELAPEEAVEILVARVVQGKVAAGNQAGFDVHKSALFPGQTFQVKFSAPVVRKGSTKMIGDRKVTIKDTYHWVFSTGNSEYKADWYVLFGKRESLVYPFLLSYDEWRSAASRSGKTEILSITTQEYSRCGRYANSWKRNRKWEYHIRDWPSGLLAALETMRLSDQLKMAI